MKKLLFLCCALFMSTFIFGQSSSRIIGYWETVNDQTGEYEYIVEITDADGKFAGKILRVLDPTRKDDVCSNCPAAMKGKPLLGLQIMKGVLKDGTEYKGGTIVDPKSGKEFKCTITPVGAAKVQVRMYTGVSMLGRRQTWTRL